MASGVVEKDAVVKAVVAAYIGYNPVKAKQADAPESWKWSSYALAVNDYDENAKGDWRGAGEYRASQAIRATMRLFSGAYIGHSAGFLKRVAGFLPGRTGCGLHSAGLSPFCCPRFV